MVKCIIEINEEVKLDIQLVRAVYNILYNRKSPKKQIQILTDRLN